MLQRFFELVATAGQGRAFRLLLQDMALCQVWVAAKGSRHDVLAGLIRDWCASPDSQDLNTAGRRHQFVLRALIAQLEKKGCESLAGDEAAFLCCAYELAAKTRDRSHGQRIEDLLRAHVRDLANRRDQRELTPGLAALDRHITYVTEEDIRQAPQSHVRLLAGIELPCRGPVLKAAGHLRILGDVPDNCTVVAEENGYCCVDGYVMGRILSKHYCEIRYNISGVAIVLDGHIRARSIINNAMAIAKMGSVHCSAAQGPKLVFAGKAVHIAENTMMGKIVTRDLTVGKDVRGSHIEIAGEGKADYFRHLGMSNTAIVLRRELSCEDFGEVTGAELNQLLSRAYKLRRHARNFSHLAEAQRHEANHTAQSTLMMLFGGGEVQKRLESFLHAQKRHRFVSQVVDNLRSMLDYAEDPFHDGDEEVATGVLESEESLEKDDEELKTARAEATKLASSLRAKSHDRKQTRVILDEIREKLSAMQALQVRLAERMAEEERSIQNLEKYDQILAGSGKEATKLDVLNRILPALQQQPPDSVVGKRLRAPFVVRALRTIERAVSHAKTFDQKAHDYLTDFRAVSERLGKDYQVRVLENPEDEKGSARISGHFEPGIRIYMNQFEENAADAPEGSILITPDDDTRRTYRRDGDGTRFYSSEA